MLQENDLSMFKNRYEEFDYAKKSSYRLSVHRRSWPNLCSEFTF